MKVFLFLTCKRRQKLKLRTSVRVTTRYGDDVVFLFTPSRSSPRGVGQPAMVCSSFPSGVGHSLRYASLLNLESVLILIHIFSPKSHSTFQLLEKPWSQLSSFFSLGEWLSQRSSNILRILRTHSLVLSARQVLSKNVPTITSTRRDSNLELDFSRDEIHLRTTRVQSNFIGDAIVSSS